MKQLKAVEITNKLMELSKLGETDFKDQGYGMISRAKLTIDPPDALVTLGLVVTREEGLEYLSEVTTGLVLAGAIGELPMERVLPQALTFGLIIGAALANKPVNQA